MLHESLVSPLDMCLWTSSLRVTHVSTCTLNLPYSGISILTSGHLSHPQRSLPLSPLPQRNLRPFINPQIQPTPQRRPDRPHKTPPRQPPPSQPLPNQPKPPLIPHHNPRLYRIQRRRHNRATYARTSRRIPRPYQRPTRPLPHIPLLKLRAHPPPPLQRLKHRELHCREREVPHNQRGVTIP